MQHLCLNIRELKYSQMAPRDRDRDSLAGELFERIRYAIVHLQYICIHTLMYVSMLQLENKFLKKSHVIIQITKHAFTKIKAGHLIITLHYKHFHVGVGGIPVCSGIAVLN